MNWERGLKDALIYSGVIIAAVGIIGAGYAVLPLHIWRIGVGALVVVSLVWMVWVLAKGEG